MLKLLLVLAIACLVVYATARVIQRRGIAPGSGRSAPPGRPASPDDDPDFLRELDFQRWQERRRLEDGNDT